MCDVFFWVRKDLLSCDNGDPNWCNVVCLSWSSKCCSLLFCVCFPFSCIGRCIVYLALSRCSGSNLRKSQIAFRWRCSLYISWKMLVYLRYISNATLLLDPSYVLEFQLADPLLQLCCLIPVVFSNTGIPVGSPFVAIEVWPYLGFNRIHVGNLRIPSCVSTEVKTNCYTNCRSFIHGFWLPILFLLGFFDFFLPVSTGLGFEFWLPILFVLVFIFFFFLLVVICRCLHPIRFLFAFYMLAGCGRFPPLC